MILSAVRADKEYKNLIYELGKLKLEKERFPVVAQGLCDGSLETFAAAVSRDMKEKALIVAGDEKTAVKLQNAMLNFFGRVYVYPKKDFIFMGMENINNPFEQERMKILGKVLNGNFDVVITTLDAMLQYTLPGEKLIEYSLSLKIGETIKDLNGFLNKLVAAGYKRADIVEEPARFSIRGGIIDIFSPSEDYPVRIELFGDEIDAMGIFDPLTQRRIENIKEFTAIPASEIVLDDKARKNCISVLENLVKGKNSGKIEQNVKDRLYFEIDSLKNNEDISSKDRFISCIYDFNDANSNGKKECLLDYFDPENLILFINESAKINEKQKASEQIMEETVVDLIEKGYIDGKNAEYCMSLDDFHLSRTRFKTVICDTFVSGMDMKLSGLYSFTTRQSPHFSEGFSILKDDLDRYASSGYRTVVFLDSDAGIKSFADYLTDFEIKYILPDPKDIKDINGKYGDAENLPAGFIAIIKTPKIEYKNNILFDMQGFELPKQKFVLITDSRSDKRAEGLKRRGVRSNVQETGGRFAKTARQKLMAYTDLSVGDYVVHNNYGIGKFLGIERLSVSGGVQKDFIKIQYQGTDILYVPCNQLDLVSKYIGAGSEDSTVRLSKMGGPNWSKAKTRAKTAARDIAKQLIKLYAARQNKAGHAFSPDTEWQKDFESLFEYAETDDQLICAEQIKDDMMRPVPMDRLLCGDVGFGKTEVALRAVFKCVTESKQAAILVPTTILAWQHYQTILSRFREFPVKIDFLSRFKSKKEQEEVIKKLKAGTVDIIIGTHRIIQKDIKFKNLGLLIVDEEQRFGVAHKEKLKQLAENIDVLTLTATPIPRTLNMALSGIRDMSVIEEAPHDRIPVQTYIFEYDANVIAEAVKNEVRRGGQVFYLHNRVETIEQTAYRLAEICGGDIKIGVGHGQMDEESLSKVWRNMLDGEIDVLVCTTIIESGIDIPDANTLIVEDADRLGLAQLHQIRGRVGRSNRRAYAYFTYPKHKVLSEISAKRLTAIREYTEFGSGFKIAMRDLEIRGAGNLLGAEQHGQMDAVGYDLYVKILEKAVSEEKKKFNLKKKYGLTDEDYGDLFDTDDIENMDDSELVGRDGPGLPPPVLQKDFEPEPTECLIDVAVDAFIPNRYIESELLRIEIYKRIAAVESKDDADDLKDELMDRFGDIPKPVANLIDIALIRNSACVEYIDSIENKDQKSIVIYSKILAQPYGLKTLEKWTIAASKMNGRLLLSMGQKPHVAYFLKDGENIIDCLKEIMNVLGEIKIVGDGVPDVPQV